MTALVVLLFFLSGFTGLVYEVVWAKYFALLLGSTAYAQVGVLAVFMGGLALGARLWSGIAERAARPLRLYGHLEILIGLSALAFVLVFDALTHVYWSLLGIAGDFWLARVVVKTLICAATMGLPTVAMGGTLPVLVRTIAGGTRIGTSVALLYAVNSFGAAAGSLVGGFVLIPELGLDAPVIGAALANLAIGLGAYAVDATLGAAAATRQTAAGPTTTGPSGSMPLFILLAAGTCGAVAMVYEVAWIRLCSLVFGSSSYAFCVMLSAFILGIALGSILYRLLRPTDAEAHGWFTLLCLLAATVLLISLPWYERLPFWVSRLSYVVHGYGGGFAAHQVMMLMVALVVMLPMTIASGLLFPALAQAAAAASGDVAKAVGRVLAANTIGTITGTIGGGLWLLPWLGLRGMFLFGACVLIGLALLGWRQDVRRRRRDQLALLAALVSLVVALCLPWNLTLLSAGEFRRHEGMPPQDFASYRDSLLQQLLFYRDGATTTVSVEKQPDGEVTLRVNGKADASSRGDADTQLLVGHLPVMLQPQAQRALIIGYGSGMTVGALLQHPLKHVDVIEIAGEVIDADPLFHEFNHRPLADARVNLVIDDARTFLYAAETAYDIVISEPSNPWVAGIGNLFTREYFEQIRHRLAPGGILVQWFHAYESSDADVAVVLRTLHSVFPHIRVFQSNRYDLVMTASNDDAVLRTLDAGVLARATGLHRFGVNAVTTVLGMEVLSAVQVGQVVRAGPINQDRRPILEYSVPRAFFSGLHASRLTQSAGLEAGRFAGWDVAQVREAIAYLRTGNMFDFPHVVALLAVWCQRAPADPELSTTLVAWLSESRRSAPLLELLVAQWETVAPSLRAEYLRTLIGIVRSSRTQPDQREVAAAAALVWEWVAAGPPGSAIVLQRLGELHTMARQPAEARRALEESKRLAPSVGDSE